MPDLNYQLELITRINNQIKKVSSNNSRLEIVKLNCLLSEYYRLYGNENRELKNTSVLSEDEINKLEKEFHEFNKYKESDEYKNNVASYKRQFENSENSEYVFVKAHIRKKR